MSGRGKRGKRGFCPSASKIKAALRENPSTSDRKEFSSNQVGFWESMVARFERKSGGFSGVAIYNWEKGKSRGCRACRAHGFELKWVA